MPTAGLSLLGFMDRSQALGHLRTICIPRDTSDAALTAQWEAARAKRGGPVPNAGRPRLQPIPETLREHLARLVREPWVAPAFAGPLRGVEFALVEIDPLIAFQFTIDKERAGFYRQKLGDNPGAAELMPICLPATAAVEDYTAIPGASSIVIKGRSLNLRIAQQGLFDGEIAGVQFSVALPFVSVALCKGRYYLQNGYNRAYGIRQSGATVMPCMIREVAELTSVGLKSDGTTFTAAVLQGDDVPTFGHFAQGRASDVTLRKVSRIIQVSWAEYAVPDE